MLQEVFYKFLMMIKKIKPEIKFIISGDYDQLESVNDRISQYTDYANSPCLFELSDYNKIQLTKCRRADDKLYNLIQFNNVPNLKISDAVSVRPLTPARVGFGYFLYCVLAGLPPRRRQYSKSPCRRPPLRGPPTSGPTTPAPQGAQPRKNSADHARSTPRDN